MMGGQETGLRLHESCLQTPAGRGKSSRKLEPTFFSSPVVHVLGLIKTHFPMKLNDLILRELTSGSIGRWQLTKVSDMRVCPINTSRIWSLCWIGKAFQNFAEKFLVVEVTFPLFWPAPFSPLAELMAAIALLSAAPWYPISSYWVTNACRLTLSLSDHALWVEPLLVWGTRVLTKIPHLSMVFRQNWVCNSCGCMILTLTSIVL